MLCIPLKVQKNKDMLLQPKYLYGIILDMTANFNECWLNNDELAGRCGVKPRSIQVWMKALLEAGYISIRYTDDAELKKAFGRNSSIRMVAALVGVDCSDRIYDLSNAESEGLTLEGIK